VVTTWRLACQFSLFSPWNSIFPTTTDVTGSSEHVARMDRFLFYRISYRQTSNSVDQPHYCCANRKTNVPVYFIISSIWKQQFLNCVMRLRSTCTVRGAIQTRCRPNGT